MVLLVHVLKYINLFPTEISDFFVNRSAFIVSFASFNGPLSGINVANFVSLGIPPDIFFLNLPITFGYYYCVLVDIIDDDVIENTEEFIFRFMTQNENDAVEFDAATVSILDNDGMLASM